MFLLITVIFLTYLDFTFSSLKYHSFINICSNLVIWSNCRVEICFTHVSVQDAISYVWIIWKRLLPLKIIRTMESSRRHPCRFVKPPPHLLEWDAQSGVRHCRQFSAVLSSISATTDLKGFPRLLSNWAKRFYDCPDRKTLGDQPQQSYNDSGKSLASFRTAIRSFKTHVLEWRTWNFHHQSTNS